MTRPATPLPPTENPPSGDKPNEKPWLRKKWLHLKVSEAERDALNREAAAKGITVADLLRSSIGREVSGKAPRNRRPIANYADPQLLAALGRIGNNMNQIGRWVNTHKAGADAVEVLAALLAIDRSLKALVPPKPERPPRKPKETGEGGNDAGSAL